MNVNPIEQQERKMKHKQGPPEQGARVRIKTRSMDINIIVNDEIDWEIVQRALLRANNQRYAVLEQ